MLWILAFLLVCLVLVLNSCTTLIEGLKRTDTVHTERTITVRDTAVYTKADSATIKLVMDIQAMRKMLADLKENGPRTVRGSSHARMVMQVVGDTLQLDAFCDSLEHLLKGAIRDRETLIREKSEVERTLTNTKAEQKGVMPGWMKGTLWIIVAASAAILIIASTVPKLLFKRS